MIATNVEMEERDIQPRPPTHRRTQRLLQRTMAEFEGVPPLVEALIPVATAVSHPVEQVEPARPRPAEQPQESLPNPRSDMRNSEVIIPASPRQQ